MHNEDRFLGKSKKQKRTANTNPTIPSAHSNMILAAIPSQTSADAAVPQTNLLEDESMDVNIDFDIPGSEEPETMAQSRSEC
jgi:hypothetical protein